MMRSVGHSKDSEKFKCEYNRKQAGEQLGWHVGGLRQGGWSVECGSPRALSAMLRSLRFTLKELTSDTDTLSCIDGVPGIT